MSGRLERLAADGIQPRLSDAEILAVGGGATALHPEAHALTLFRALPDGRGRQYTAVTFPRDPWQGCERTIRIARAFGWVAEPADGAYAVLDVLNVLNVNGDIVQDFSVPTAQVFRWFKRNLNLAVELTDAD